MDKKIMKFLSLFKSKDENLFSTSSWSWPSCNKPKTLSFRANKKDVLIKSFKSTFVDTTSSEILETFESLVTEIDFEDLRTNGNSIEAVIQVLRSDRLFFEPNQSSSISKTKENNSSDGIISGNNNNLLLPFEIVMDSRNPYEEFTKSIVEMVEAHDVNNWEKLEKLLSWYLKVNEKSNYEIIISAFFDLFVANSFCFNASPPCSESNHESPDSSPLSINSCSSWSTLYVSSYSSPL